MRLVPLWLFATALAAAIVTPASANVEDGVRKWRAGDYAGAVAAWQKPAAAGDRDAQFNLGQAYKLGRGVPEDPAKAIEFYRKAAAQGHEPAEANLGWVLFQNGNRQEALPLLQRAATRGDAHSQYLLGIAYFNGDVVPQDWPRAYRLMNAAASSGLPQARDALDAMNARIPLSERQKALEAADTLLSASPRPATSTSAARSATSRRQTLQPAFSATPATPGKSSAPSATSAAPANWRVQLGAFSTQKAAAAAWTSLTSQVDVLGTLAPIYVNNGKVVRLQAGPVPDRAAAGNLCAKVTASGGACLPIQP